MLREWWEKNQIGAFEPVFRLIIYHIERYNDDSNELGWSLVVRILVGRVRRKKNLTK